MRKLFSWLWGWIRDEAVSQVFTSTWFWALVATGIAALLGLVQDLPALWVYLGSLGAAGIVFVLLAANSVRRSLSSPKYKIVVEALIPEDWEENGQRHFRPKLQFRNLGNFPIEVDVKDIEWELDGSKGEQFSFHQTSAIVPPQGMQFLRGPRFVRRKISNPEETGFETPEVKVRLKYGNIGKMKYTHSQDYVMQIYFGLHRFRDASLIQQGRGRHA